MDGQLMRDVFANWYYNRVGRSKVEDCTEPDCNGSCPVGPTDGRPDLEPIIPLNLHRFLTNCPYYSFKMPLLKHVMSCTCSEHHY